MASVTTTQLLSSLENPTWKHLNENFSKPDLQKHCRKLGVENVWITKDELIEIIIDNHRLNHPPNGNDIQNPSVSQPEPSQNIEVLKMKKKLDRLEENLNQKNIEIRELNELLKAANVTINRLNDRLTTIEDQIGSNGRLTLNNNITESTTPEESTLLLGDTNLCDIRSADLGKDTYIRTITGANIDLIKSWVSKELNWKPTRCILVCGIQDILDGETSSAILDNLATLVMELKKINENMDIHICHLLPTLRASEFGEIISYHNNQLTDWGSDNNITIMKCELYFKLATGEVDEMCFYTNKENPGIFLNRCGVIRLLDSINKQHQHFNLCEDWKEVKKALDWKGTVPESAFYQRGYSQPVTDSRDPSFRRQRYQAQEIGKERPYYSRHRQEDEPTIEGNYDRADEARQRDQRYKGHPGHYKTNTHDRRHPTSYRDSGASQSSREETSNELRSIRRGCFNCGEFNHRQNTCRFDHKIRCGRCGSLGHKSRLCLANHHN